MSGQKPLVSRDATLLGLKVDRDDGVAILEIDLPDVGRIAINLSQQQLQCLYQYILSAAFEGHLDFALRPETKT